MWLESFVKLVAQRRYQVEQSTSWFDPTKQHVNTSSDFYKASLAQLQSAHDDLVAEPVASKTVRHYILAALELYVCHEIQQVFIRQPECRFSVAMQDVRNLLKEASKPEGLLATLQRATNRKNEFGLHTIISVLNAAHISLWNAYQETTISEALTQYAAENYSSYSDRIWGYRDSSGDIVPRKQMNLGAQLIPLEQCVTDADIIYALVEDTLIIDFSVDTVKDRISQLHFNYCKSATQQ